MIQSRTLKSAILPLCLALLSGALPFPNRLFVCPAHGQRHPPEVRTVYPVGGSAGATTRVTISGMSFRSAGQLLFDRPGISAAIVPQDATKLPAPTLDSDGNPDVIADITVAKTTAPGPCRFRVVSPSGVSDAGVWMVGRDVPQIDEKEPNNDSSQAQAVTLPVAVNGRIGDSGDQDTFSVDLQAGQTFVAEVIANRVGSPLDSLLTLRSAQGRELASNDDHNGPDSLLVYTPKTSGKYLLTLASSDGAASVNHTYRLEMGVLPLLTAIFPAGAQVGQGGNVTAMGVNLAATPSLTVPLTPSSSAGTGRLFVSTTRGSSNSLPVLLSTLPVIAEQEPNDDRPHATFLPTPGIANGRFWHGPKADTLDKSRAADVDFYKFKGEAGQRYIIDIYCQTLNTPADPMLTLYGPDGKMVAENDDANGRDAHLDVTLLVGGEYAIRVTEVRAQSGADMAYCLVAQTPPPGFTLSTETRTRSVGQGGIVPLEVNVVRDRWDGPVVLGLKDLPPGVTATTCLVPAGVGKGLLLLSADKTAPLTAFPLHIIGTGQVQGTTIQHTLEAASDWVWKGGQRANTPVPAGMLTFAVSEPFEITPAVDAQTVSLARGQSATLKVKLTRQIGYAKPVTLRVLGLPEGVTAADVALTPDKPEGTIEIKATAMARLGAVPITVSCVVSQSQFVQLDRVTPAVTLTVVEAPKK